MKNKYMVRVEVVKEFGINFPDNLFTPEHMQDIRDYCEYNRDVDEQLLKERIIEAWTNSGVSGYFEQFGAYMGYRLPALLKDEVPFIEIFDPWTDVGDIYMEEG